MKRDCQLNQWACGRGAIIIQSCPTLCNPMDCNSPGFCPWNSPSKNTGVGCHSLLQGIFSRDQTQVSHIVGKFFTEPSGNPQILRSLVWFSQSCPTLCDPMNCSTLGLPVHHQLLESTQTHVHCVSDAIQPFHPLLSPSPPALNVS